VPAGLLDLLALPDAPATAANDPIPIGAGDAHRAALPHERRWHWREWGAIAASLVVGVVVGGRVLVPHPTVGSTDRVALDVRGDGAVVAQGALRDALEQRIAGTVLDPNSPIAVGLTFRDRARDYCRTFTLDAASSGIACKQADGWVVAHLERTPGRAAPPSAGVAGAYRTAASPYGPGLLQAVDALRDGDTLDAAAETAARAKGWRP
jgi:hypothetical protein